MCYNGKTQTFGQGIVMHTFATHFYPNLLPEIHLTSDEIRGAISKYRLSFLQERNMAVEWGMELPMFVDAFYNYIVSRQSIPNQDESYRHYLDFNKTVFETLKRPDLESGIKARYYRTYPSLVRDVHFNKYIEERLGSRCQVIYNTKLDIEEGIDLMIVTRKNNYGICFFTNTRRAYTGREAKTNRHVPFDNVKYVEMPVNFQSSVRAGSFFLYGENEYNNLYDTLCKCNMSK